MRNPQPRRVIGAPFQTTSGEAYRYAFLILALILGVEAVYRTSVLKVRCPQTEQGYCSSLLLGLVSVPLGIGGRIYRARGLTLTYNGC